MIQIKALPITRVEVLYDNEGAIITTTYSVHRFVLAPTSSYFKRLFNNPNYVEAKVKRSSIQVSALAAETFPYFLDYLYGQFSDSGEISRLQTYEYNQDVGLYWLADYFGVPALTSDVDSVFIADLKLRSCHAYLEAALELGVHHVVDAVTQCCSEKLFLGDGMCGQDLDDLAKSFDVTSLIALLEKMDGKKSVSQKASLFVAAFFGQHDVDAETFAGLTDAAMLPHFDPKAALVFLGKERELLGQQGMPLSSLKERCIDALALARNLTESDIHEEGPLRVQSSAFLLKLFQRTREHWIANSMEE
jgi:hypothetical protein